MEQFLHLMDRDSTRNKVIPFFVLKDLNYVCRLILVVNFSGNFLKDIFNGDESRNPAILIHYDSHMGCLVLQV